MAYKQDSTRWVEVRVSKTGKLIPSVRGGEAKQERETEDWRGRGGKSGFLGKREHGGEGPSQQDVLWCPLLWEGRRDA